MKHCVYCGMGTRGRACVAHRDLPKLDPMELLRRPLFVLATVYAPRLKKAEPDAPPITEAHPALTEGGF